MHSLLRTVVSTCASLYVLHATGLAQGDPTLFDWDNVHHVPAATELSGSTSVTLDESTQLITFTYQRGDDLIRYQIGLLWENVQHGMIQVREVTTGSEPISEGGLSWRTASAFKTPKEHYDQMVGSGSISRQLSYDPPTKTVTLAYEETTDLDGAGPGTATLTTKKEYLFWLEGKSLRIRARASTSPPYLASIDNYTGFTAGPSNDTPNAEEQHIPGMDSTMVVRFGGAANHYYSVLLDWYESRGTTLTLKGPSVPGAQPYEFGFTTRYHPNDLGQLMASVDETISLTVTDRIYDLFPLIPFAASDHYDLLKDKMMIQSAGVDKTSHGYAQLALQFEKFNEWGMTDVAVTLHGWTKYGLNIMPPDGSLTPSVIGCDPDNGITYESYTVNEINGTYPVKVVDPELPANVSLAKAEFGALTDRVMVQNGWLLSMYQGPGMVDPQGDGALIGPSYDTSIPLSYPQSKTTATPTIPSVRVGVLVPDQNTLYPAWAGKLTQDQTGAPHTGWNTSWNLEHTSWDTDPDNPGGGLGHPLHVVAHNHRLQYWTDSFSQAAADFAPNARFIDASGTLPKSFSIDRTSMSGMPHTIGDALKEKVKALWQYKYQQGTPLFGEPAHARNLQFESYASGVWDSVRRYHPGSTVIPNEEPSRDLRIIPDYELRCVKPISPGHSGMGVEDGNHWAAGELVVPFDDHVLNPGFFDSWLTNIVTFNHNAFGLTRGQVSGAHWSAEGYIRNYYLITPLQSWFRTKAIDNVASIKYLGLIDDSIRMTLDEAMAVDYDFVNAKIHILYDNGLEIWANHDKNGGTHPNLSVDVPVQNVPIEIPPDGFVAFASNGLLVFSAINPDPTSSGQARIDYANVPGKYEMISCRGSVQKFQGFPSLTTIRKFDDRDEADFAQATIIRNYEVAGPNGVNGILIGADKGRWNFDRTDPDFGSWGQGGGAGVEVVDM